MNLIETMLAVVGMSWTQREKEWVDLGVDHTLIEAMHHCYNDLGQLILTDGTLLNIS